jgi:hypothetical protein
VQWQLMAVKSVCLGHLASLSKPFKRNNLTLRKLNCAISLVQSSGQSAETGCRLGKQVHNAASDCGLIVQERVRRHQDVAVCCTTYWQGKGIG